MTVRSRGCEEPFSLAADSSVLQYDPQLLHPHAARPELCRSALTSAKSARTHKPSTAASEMNDHLRHTCRDLHSTQCTPVVPRVLHLGTVRSLESVLHRCLSGCFSLLGHVNSVLATKWSNPGFTVDETSGSTQTSACFLCISPSGEDVEEDSWYVHMSIHQIYHVFMLETQYNRIMHPETILSSEVNTVQV